MCGLSTRGTNTNYNTHSLYGWSQTVATKAALDQTLKRRAPVITRSTIPSSGRYSGHWLGDNAARWEDLRVAIIGVQEFNLFGIPYVGSDVCGFRLATNEELCLRWQQLGAFHSFFRNHNDIGVPDQDPPQWPAVALATREANLFRYRHLPYLYSLHFRASLYGGTVVRPVFFEFPTDPIASSLSHQFMWGDSIMVLPVLYPVSHNLMPSINPWPEKALTRRGKVLTWPEKALTWPEKALTRRGKVLTWPEKALTWPEKSSTRPGKP
jgi:alpha-glucosidase (family GH31 glycosyl hydrolase)